MTIIIGGETGGQHSGQKAPGLGDPTSAPMLGMAPTGLVGAPSALISPEIAVGLGPSESEPPPEQDSDNAVASGPVAPRPYGTPVPGGVLIGADISMQIRVCSPGLASVIYGQQCRHCLHVAHVTQRRDGLPEK